MPRIKCGKSLKSNWNDAAEFCNDLISPAASEDTKFLLKTLKMRNLNDMNDLYSIVAWNN